jgi:cyanophycinase
MDAGSQSSAEVLTDTVPDGQRLISNAFAAKRTTPLLMSWAVIHTLPAGSQFDLTGRTLIAHETAVPDPEVLEACAAEADVRDLLRGRRRRPAIRRLASIPPQQAPLSSLIGVTS